MPLEEVQKNTGTPVSTEVSSQQTNPVEQPDTTVDTKAVQQTATATQPAAQNAQQPTVETSSVQETATDLGTGEKVEIRDYNDISYTDTVLDDMINNRYVGGTGIAVDAAKERYRNYRAYGGLTYKQLGDTIMSGGLYANGTTMNDIHKYNPELWTQTQNYIMNQSDVANLNEQMYNTYSNMNGVETNKNYVKNTVTTSTSDGKSETTSSITEFSDELMNFLQSYGIQSGALVDIMKEKLQSSDIQLAKNKILVQEEKIRTIQKQIDEVGEDARKMLGSSAPESLVSAYISQQTKLLQRQLNTENNSLLTLQGKLDNLLDDAKMELDYTVKEMQMNQDLAKSILGLKGSSSSSSKSTVGEGLTQDAVNSVKKAIIDGTFGGSFTSDVKKFYGLPSDASEDTVLKKIAETSQVDEIRQMKDNLSEAQYKKLLKAFYNTRKEDLKKFFIENIDNPRGLYEWIDGLGLVEKDVKALLEGSETTVAQRNALYRILGWELDMGADTIALEANEQKAIAKSQGEDYVSKINSGKSKESSESGRSMKADALKGRFILDRDKYGIPDGMKAVDIGKLLGAEIDTYKEFSKIINNTSSSFDTDANKNSFISGLYNGYLDANWGNWVTSLKNMKSKGATDKQIKYYVSNLLPGTSEDNSLFSEEYKAQLLKDAGFNSTEIAKLYPSK